MKRPRQVKNIKVNQLNEQEENREITNWYIVKLREKAQIPGNHSLKISFKVNSYSSSNKPVGGFPLEDCAGWRKGKTDGNGPTISLKLKFGKGDDEPDEGGH